MILKSGKLVELFVNYVQKTASKQQCLFLKMAYRVLFIQTLYAIFVYVLDWYYANLHLEYALIMIE